MAVAVAAVGAGDQVIVAQGGDGTHGHGLLAGVQMRCALDDVAPQQVVDRLLEHPDLPHLAQQVQRLFLGQAVGLR